jgi:AcrR family transcriptional regulator
MGIREQKKQRVRDELADAALALFDERGYEQTRVRDIVARVGVSEPTFFNYFAAKEHVLDELALPYFELLRLAIAQQRLATEDMRTRVLAVTTEAARAIEADRDLYALIYVRSNILHPAGRLAERAAEVHGELAALFEIGQERGEIHRGPEPAKLAEMLLAIVHLTALNWLRDPARPKHGLGAAMSVATHIFFEGAHEPSTRKAGARKG